MAHLPLRAWLPVLRYRSNTWKVPHRSSHYGQCPASPYIDHTKGFCQARTPHGFVSFLEAPKVAHWLPVNSRAVHPISNILAVFRATLPSTIGSRMLATWIPTGSGMPPLFRIVPRWRHRYSLEVVSLEFLFWSFIFLPLSCCRQLKIVTIKNWSYMIVCKLAELSIEKPKHVSFLSSFIKNRENKYLLKLPFLSFESFHQVLHSFLDY